MLWHGVALCLSVVPSSLLCLRELLALSLNPSRDVSLFLDLESHPRRGYLLVNVVDHESGS